MTIEDFTRAPNDADDVKGENERWQNLALAPSILLVCVGWRERGGYRELKRKSWWG